MLVREGDITVEVILKKDRYHVALYYRDDGREKYKEFSIPYEEWQGDNQFRSFLINHRMTSIWALLDDNSDPLVRILHNITRVVDYGVKSGMDVYLGDAVFRLKEKDYIFPTNFQIWYIATMHRIAIIKEGEWQEFVAQCLRIATPSNHDPLEPDIVEGLMEMFKESEVHSLFCDVVYEYTVSGSTGTRYFVLDYDEKIVYVPKPITTYLAQREKLSKKRVRQFLLPFLVRPDDMRMYVGIQRRPQQLVRFWGLSLEKIARYDEAAAEHLIKNRKDCKTECEIDD
jgi:hypothetical protein